MFVGGGGVCVWGGGGEKQFDPRVSEFLRQPMANCGIRGWGPDSLPPPTVDLPRHK